MIFQFVVVLCKTHLYFILMSQSKIHAFSPCQFSLEHLYNLKDTFLYLFQMLEFIHLLTQILYLCFRNSNFILILIKKTMAFYLYFKIKIPQSLSLVFQELKRRVFSIFKVFQQIHSQVLFTFQNFEFEIHFISMQFTLYMIFIFKLNFKFILYFLTFKLSYFFTGSSFLFFI